MAWASGFEGSVAAGGLRTLAGGKRPDLAQLLLTPDKTLRLTDGLSQLRGAEAWANPVGGRSHAQRDAAHSLFWLGHSAAPSGSDPMVEAYCRDTTSQR